MNHARPAVDSDVIFQKMRAPHGKIHPAYIYNVVSRSLKGSGADISCKRHGPHALRSSMASAMVSDGIPYHVVSDLLGHENRDVIKSYARIDIENLRKCSIEPLSAEGSFYAMLEGVMSVC